MKISEIKIYTEEDYSGAFNLAKLERELICKALTMSSGNVKDATVLLRTSEKKVYSAIFKHSLQSFLEKVRNEKYSFSKNNRKQHTNTKSVVQFSN